MNKKGVSNIMENVVFILLVVAFMAIMLFALTRAGSQATLFEQVHAKQIALIINKAKPGMEVELDTFELQKIAKKNKFAGKIVDIDNKKNRVKVKLVKGKGYDYYYFSDIDVVWNLDKEKRILFLKMVKPKSEIVSEEEVIEPAVEEEVEEVVEVGEQT